MSSDEEVETEEVQFFKLVEKNCKEELQVGLTGSGITTMDLLMAQYGMGEDNPNDAAVIAVLQKAKNIDAGVSLALDGDDAASLRLLHRKGKREYSTPPGKKAKTSPNVAGTAAEDAEDTKVATRAFARLKTTQNVSIPIEDQLHHGLVHTLVRNLETTGTIHYAWELKALRREGEKRVGFRKIKGSSLFEEDRGFLDDDEAKRGSHGAVTEAILLFVDGLAAVLGKEVKPGKTGSPLLVLKSGTTEYMVVHATYHEVLTFGRIVIKACGQNPLRYAEGIFRQAVNKQMALFKELGLFALATTTLSQHWPGVLQPNSEDKALFESEQKVKRKHTHTHTHTHTQRTLVSHTHKHTQAHTHTLSRTTHHTHTHTHTRR